MMDALVPWIAALLTSVMSGLVFYCAAQRATSDRVGHGLVDIVVWAWTKLRRAIERAMYGRTAEMEREPEPRTRLQELIDDTTVPLVELVTEAEAIAERDAAQLRLDQNLTDLRRAVERMQAEDRRREQEAQIRAWSAAAELPGWAQNENPYETKDDPR